MTIDRGRRDALKMIVGGAAGVAVGPFVLRGPLGDAFAAPEVKGPGKPVVVRTRREGWTAADGTVVPDVAFAPLGAALARAAGEKSPVDAMKKLVKPTDVVALKVNCIAGKGLSPQPKLVQQLAEWVIAAGVPARQVVIWERTSRELKNAGFVESGGVRVVGTDDAYEDTVREWGAGGSCFAKLLVNEVTALINVGLLKDHGLAGVSHGMKNWYGAIHNPNKYHDEGCNPYIPDLAASTEITKRLRLTVVDGTVGQCNAGPGRSPKWAWSYGGALVSTDPVAIDALGWREIEAQRKVMGLKTLTEEGRAPRYIAAAAKKGLGVADLERVEVVEA
jgi:uncharacterized protein (DUF362 family)